MHNEGNYKQGEKVAFRMGENNSKLNNWQRINLQNTQAAHAAQYQENKQPNQKVGQRIKQTFLQRSIQMANKHMKRCSTSLLLREIQIKTIMRYHLMPVRMAAIKKSTNNKCWRGCGEKGILLHCWWESKGTAIMQNSVEIHLKAGNRTVKSHCIPRNLTAGHTPWGNQNWKRHVHPSVHCSTVYNSQEIEAT